MTNPPMKNRRGPQTFTTSISTHRNYNVALLERGVSTLEPRFTHRVLCTLTALRKRIKDTVLREAIELTYAKGDHLFYIYSFSHVCILNNYDIDNATKETLLSWRRAGRPKKVLSSLSLSHLLSSLSMYHNSIIAIELLSSSHIKEYYT